MYQGSYKNESKIPKGETSSLQDIFCQSVTKKKQARDQLSDPCCALASRSVGSFVIYHSVLITYEKGSAGFQIVFPKVGYHARKIRLTFGALIAKGKKFISWPDRYCTVNSPFTLSRPESDVQDEKGGSKETVFRVQRAAQTNRVKMEKIHNLVLWSSKS